MYKVIIVNGAVETVIHSDDPSPEKAKIVSGKILREVNKISSFSFSMHTGNPGYNITEHYSTKVKVSNTRTGDTVFEGRVLISAPAMSEDGSVQKDVTAEGITAYLHDSIQPYMEEKYWEGDSDRTGLEEFIDYVLDVHNSQVEDEKKIYRGRVTVHPFESSDNITKGLNHEDTYNCLMDKLVDSFGGEMDVRRGEDGILYFDYMDNLGVTEDTPIKLGLNIRSHTQERDPSNLITRLFAYGAKLTKTVEESGKTYEQETDERLTLAEVNDGKEYIDDEEGVERYGIVPGVVEYDDVTEAANLLVKAQEYLAGQSTVSVSNTVKIADLSLINENYGAYEIYNSYPVENALVGLAGETVRVVAQEINILSPEESAITLGSKATTLSSYTSNMEKAYKQTAANIAQANATGDSNSASINALQSNVKSIYAQMREYAEMLVSGSITTMLLDSDGYALCDSDGLALLNTEYIYILS